MEMTEGVENCSSEEARALVLEVTEDEYSKCRVSTTKYPKASHLGLTGVEICGELPNDFDLLILRQLEGFDVAVECRSIIGKNNSHGPMLTPKCGSHMYTLRKESHSLRDCCLERKEDVSQLLSQKSEKNAGFLCCKIEKTGIFHFCKTVNPRCPPHLNKKIMLPSSTLYEVEAKSPGQPDNKGSADDKSGEGYPKT